jgi:hypothetical protein
MVLNRVGLAAHGLALLGLAFLGVTALAWSGLASAQQYRTGEFLNLDLSRAVLSPKPLGPAASFTPGPLDVTIDRGKDASQANAESVLDPKAVPTATVHAGNAVASSTTAPRTALKAATTATRVAHARVERAPARKPRALVALHGRNPIEAQARDTSVQVWPCKSGGICNWKR